MVEITEKTRRLARAWGTFVDLVRLEQTVFALPFAYTGMLLAAGGLPSGPTFLWITVAMVAARTAGMALNRLIDREIDARNPRTRERALPAGRLAPQPVAWLAAGSLAILVLAAACLNPLCLALSPLAVGLLWGYSYLKRFTWACHLGLGLVQACGPVGAWLAVTGRFEPPPLLLGAAIMLWVGGFDILYACQDIEVDRRQGLHSLPACLGVEGAFRIARLAHAGMLVCLVWTGLLLDLGLPYWAGLGAVGSLLVWEHSLLSPQDLSRIQQAFFTCNALVSLTLLAGVAGDLWL
ncbi:MAG TPA: UbiA-like polyprenyltransferase [Candidatus Nitrosotenuis sp.]|nr:UbiA-like polyprenyltransferase [Candidatus Nitrosotenuis sp.]